jgi:hypothetical protein
MDFVGQKQNQKRARIPVRRGSFLGLLQKGAKIP